MAQSKAKRDREKPKEKNKNAFASMFVSPPTAKTSATVSLLEKQVAMRKGLKHDPFLIAASRLLPKYNYSAVWCQALFDFWESGTMTAVCFNHESTDRVQAEILDRWYYIRSGILVFRCDYGDLNRLSYICSCLPHVKGIGARRDLINHEDASLAPKRIKADFALPLWEEARLFLDPSRIGTQQPDHTIKLILS